MSAIFDQSPIFDEISLITNAELEAAAKAYLANLDLSRAQQCREYIRARELGHIAPYVESTDFRWWNLNILKDKANPDDWKPKKERR